MWHQKYFFQGRLPEIQALPRVLQALKLLQALGLGSDWSPFKLGRHRSAG